MPERFEDEFTTNLTINLPGTVTKKLRETYDNLRNLRKSGPRLAIAILLKCDFVVELCSS